jgi:hypothetical protein
MRTVSSHVFVLSPPSSSSSSSSFSSSACSSCFLLHFSYYFRKVRLARVRRKHPCVGMGLQPLCRHRTRSRHSHWISPSPGTSTPTPRMLTPRVASTCKACTWPRARWSSSSVWTRLCGERRPRCVQLPITIPFCHVLRSSPTVRTSSSSSSP